MHIGTGIIELQQLTSGNFLETVFIL